MKKNIAKLAALVVGASFTTAAMAISPFSQNFEAMNGADPAVLTNDGWRYYAAVFDVGGIFLYQYFGPDAPNGTNGFSSVAGGEGGVNQGNQYINIYSDYGNQGAHTAGYRVDASVYQERLISAADLGLTFNFRFDYKAATSPFGPSGATTTAAFMKILDPSNNYATLLDPTLDTTAASTSVWSEGNILSVTIDNSWTGKLLQFGFISKATNNQPSGVFYDNIVFAPVSASALSGTISFNDFVGSQAGRTVSVVVTAVGSSTPLFSGSATLGATGGYSISVPGLAAGSYDLYVDGTPFLKKKQSLTWTASGATAVNASLVNGDSDNSGEVDAADIDLVIAAFGALVGNGNYSVSVDVDGSGEVDAADIDVVIANFGELDN